MNGLFILRIRCKLLLLSNYFHGILPEFPGRVPRGVLVLVVQFLQRLDILCMPIDQYLAMFIQWLIGFSIGQSVNFACYSAF